MPMSGSLLLRPLDLMSMQEERHKNWGKRSEVIAAIDASQELQKIGNTSLF